MEAILMEDIPTSALYNEPQQVLFIPEDLPPSPEAALAILKLITNRPLQEKGTTPWTAS